MHGENRDSNFGDVGNIAYSGTDDMDGIAKIGFHRNKRSFGSDRNFAGQYEVLQMLKSLPIIATFFFIVFYAFLVRPAFAEQTVKTIEIPFGYVSQSVANQWYSKDLILSSPDGIDKILTSVFSVKGDFQASTKIYLEIDGKTCNEAYWTIPNQNVADYTVLFDCSNLANNKASGSYSIRVKTDKIAQNLFATIKFTYYNNPFGDLKMSGTEYLLGESGTVFLQLKNANGQPVVDGSCIGDIFNPDKTFFTHDFPFIHLATSDGLYYHDFSVPQQAGVYMISAFCYYNVTQAGDFYATAEKIIDGSVATGDYTDTYTDNGKYLRVVDDGLKLKYQLNYTGIVLAPIVSISEIDVFFNGKFSPASSLDYGLIEIYNYSSGTFHAFSNIIPAGATDMDISNVLFMTGEKYQDFIQGGTLILQFEDFNKTYSTAGGDSLFNDLTRVSIKYSNGTIIDVKGTGEINVHDLNKSIGGQLETKPSFYDLRFSGGTEYSPNERGTFSVQFLRTVAGNPSPVTAGSCTGNFYFPNMTAWQMNVNFPEYSGSNGIYFNRSIVPNVFGVYTIDVYCTKGGITSYSTHTFHVSQNISQSIDQILFNQQSIYSYLQTMNQSVYDWFGITWNNQQTNYNYLQTLNSTIYSFHNATMTELSAIETLIQTVYDWMEYSISVLS